MLDNTIQATVHWLHMHPHAAGCVVFVIAALESLAVLGALIPGIVLMTAIGSLIGLGIIPPVTTVIWAMLGASLGDGISFFLGHHYKQQLRQRWPFTRFPDILTKGEVFFYNYGGISILLGRFVGPLRAFVPVIAGILNYNVKSYLCLNVVSSVLWAPAYLLPGILIGAASQTLPPQYALYAICIAIFALAALWLCFWGIYKLWLYLSQCLSFLFAQQHRDLTQSPYANRIQRLLAQPDLTLEPHQQLTTLTLAIIATAVLGYILLSVKQMGWITSLNHPVWFMFYNLHNTRLDSISKYFTLLGEVRVLSVFILGTAIFLAYTRHIRLALYWLATGLAIIGSVHLLKGWIHSPRPHFSGINTHGLSPYSFPSGHTTLSTTLYLAFVVLLGEQTKQRTRYYLAALVLIMLIALSRLYLGVHWLSDIVGSLSLGLAAVAWFTFLLRFMQLPSLPNARRLLLAGLTSLALGLVIHLVIHHHHFHQHKKPHLTSVSAPYWWQQATTLTTAPVRTNRFGQPEEVFNLEWAGQLDAILHTLQTHGWRQAKPANLLSTLTYLGLSTDQRQMYLPWFEQHYRGQQPVLTMFKPDLHIKQRLVLRLWNSQQQLTDSNLPLWYGTINYGLADPKHPLSFGQRFLNTFAPASSALMLELDEWQFRKIPTPRLQLLDAEPNFYHTDRLLIRPKATDAPME